jgi:hypothetical protein
MLLACFLELLIFAVYKQIYSKGGRVTMENGIAATYVLIDKITNPVIRNACLMGKIKLC